MTTDSSFLAIMFADVAGSTRLYEQLGDETAKATIDRAIDIMTSATLAHQGVVIKTIGDEVMSHFPSAQRATDAAIAIQNGIEELPAQHGNSNSISVRIGYHYGAALLQADGDVFGDAVNLAARMAALAKGQQILTTQETIDQLDASLSDKVRLFDRTTVKGKSSTLAVYQILWEHEDVTTIGSSLSNKMAIQTTDVTVPLKIFYQGEEIHIAPESTPFSFGRSEQNTLRVAATLASRNHARVEYRRGKYVLIDQSTNGTYVSTEDGKHIYLRREELPLWGKGVFSLGEETTADNSHCLNFEVDFA